MGLPARTNSRSSNNSGSSNDSSSSSNSSRSVKTSAAGDSHRTLERCISLLLLLLLLRMLLLLPVHILLLLLGGLEDAAAAARAVCEGQLLLQQGIEVHAVANLGAAAAAAAAAAAERKVVNAAAAARAAAPGAESSVGQQQQQQQQQKKKQQQQQQQEKQSKTKSKRRLLFFRLDTRSRLPKTQQRQQQQEQQQQRQQQQQQQQQQQHCCCVLLLPCCCCSVAESKMEGQKIKVENPVVEVDGDEMTRIIWQWIKEKLILKYLNLPIEYFDLSIQHRDATDDQVTVEAAKAIKRVGVGIKCATITPDEARVKEFNLKKMWKSPNATIRNILGGTIFRAPIVMKNVLLLLLLRTRRAFLQFPAPLAASVFGYAPLAAAAAAAAAAATAGFADSSGVFYFNFRGGCFKPTLLESFTILSESMTCELHRFEGGGGVCLGMYNEDGSIRDFARACFLYSLNKRMPLYLSTKNTVLKSYDGRFKDLFEEIYRQEYQHKFQEAGIT
ncbi:hypothetical protein Emag_006573 [Eimeria magna]